MQKHKTIKALGGAAACIVWLAVVFILVELTGLSAIWAENDAAGFTKRERPPVDFLDHLHEMHMDSYECLTCHHRYEDSENVLDEGELEEGNADVLCSACHHPDRALRDAFHDQCIGCHDAYNDTQSTALPVLCGDCHIRRVETE
jgi:DNA-directed RNA polymerase subunit RPC12/RpoP